MARERTGASSFDELAVGLSSGTLSRGKALKLVGAALVGGLLASLPGIAQAAPEACQPLRKECGRNCCTLDAVCCGKGAKARCCPANSTCCQGQGEILCCDRDTQICCRFRGGTTTCDTPDFCEQMGGRPR
jgi:hypothetical protein